jgi:hypothetical protein
VLLYRLMNFWAMLPIGWGAWAWLSIVTRRHPELHAGAPLAPLPADVVEAAQADGVTP